MTSKTWFFDNKCPIHIVSFESKVLEVINTYRQERYRQQLESCGILMGEKRGVDCENVNVTHLSTPEDTDERTPTYYKRNVQGHQDCLNQLHNSSRGRIQYLGEWHTHPQDKASPSHIDYMEWHKTCRYFKDIPVLFFIAGIHEDWLGIQKNEVLYLPTYFENGSY